MARGSEFRIVMVTCGSTAQARRIASALVKKRLAACVNVLSGAVESIYQWNGKVEKSRERLLLIKTSAKCLKRAEMEVRGLHSYETPEFLVVGVAGGSKAYLSWLAKSLQE